MTHIYSCFFRPTKSDFANADVGTFRVVARSIAMTTMKTFLAFVSIWS